MQAYLQKLLIDVVHPRTVGCVQFFKTFSIKVTACLSDETWLFSLSGMIPKWMVLEDDVEDEPKVSWSGFTAYRLENVFPVYAMGISDPKLDFVDSVAASGSFVSDPNWDAVREEAKLEAEKEPILNSFLYASVLCHDCLERALGFVLANRLQNPTLLATQLRDIFCDVIMNDRGIHRSIRLNMQAFKDRDPSCLSYCSAMLYLKLIDVVHPRSV